MWGAHSAVWPHSMETKVASLVRSTLVIWRIGPRGSICAIRGLSFQNFPGLFRVVVVQAIEGGADHVTLPFNLINAPLQTPATVPAQSMRN
jgi:hypothetical protein